MASDQLNKKLEEKEAQLASASTEIHHLKLTLARLLASRSWKITSPLRVIGRFFFRCHTPIQKKQKPTKLDGFDADFYRTAYPESAANPEEHFIKIGKALGRPGRAPELAPSNDIDQLNPLKQNVLLICHDCSRSGCPILTWNIARQLRSRFNVIILPLLGGELERSFQEVADLVLNPFPDAYSPEVASAVLAPFLQNVTIDLAIANSIVTRSVLPILASAGIPALCLVHEFARYVQPSSAPLEVQLWASRMIFSAAIVHADSVAHCPELATIPPTIIPQGKCLSPDSNRNSTNKTDNSHLLTLLKPTGSTEQTITILGVGKVEMRKGVDLFIGCCARLKMLCPSHAFRFVWAGSGFRPQEDLGYSVYLADQIERSELTKEFTFLGEVSDIDTVYECADLLFLSSRLDPLPNVAIEAMAAGLPVICFAETTGIAEILNTLDLGKECVAPYLQEEEAATRIAALIQQGRLIEIGQQCREGAEKLFNMASYTDQLITLAEQSRENLLTELKELQQIQEAKVFDHKFYRGPGTAHLSDTGLIRHFIRSWRAGVCRRKPFPGFHPGIFAENLGIDLSSTNPLAAWLSEGKPEGRWTSPLLLPQTVEKMQLSYPRTALHIHCYYLDQFHEIFKRLTSQQTPDIDLFISVTNKEMAETVATETANWQRGNVNIQIFPNRGRDIGPLLTGFGEALQNGYEIVGHLHTKKSPDTANAGVVELWFEFLLEHLIGGKHSMISTILNGFVDDPTLGLAFPEDPYCVGWSGNKAVAETLADELNLERPSSEFFDFPVGTMFWARAKALVPLFHRQFVWENYPAEPLSADGTMLHGMERLLPVVTKSQGFSHTLIHVPEVNR